MPLLTAVILDIMSFLRMAEKSLMSLIGGPAPAELKWIPFHSPVFVQVLNEAVTPLRDEVAQVSELSGCLLTHLKTCTVPVAVHMKRAGLSLHQADEYSPRTPPQEPKDVLLQKDFPPLLQRAAGIGDIDKYDQPQSPQPEVEVSTRPPDSDGLSLMIYKV